MAIEPIGSSNVFQTNQVQAKTVVKSEQAASEKTESTANNVAVNQEVKQWNVSSEEKSDGGDKDQLSHEQLRKAVEQLNKKNSNSEVQFGVHEATKRVTIKIVDKDTKETIKELPPEKTLDMIAKAWELAGILVDEKR